MRSASTNFSLLTGDVCDADGTSEAGGHRHHPHFVQEGSSGVFATLEVKGYHPGVAVTEQLLGQVVVRMALELRVTNAFDLDKQVVRLSHQNEPRFGRLD